MGVHDAQLQNVNMIKCDVNLKLILHGTIDQFN